MKTLFSPFVIATFTLSSLIGSATSQEVNDEIVIVDLARRRAADGDQQSLIFLSLRAKLLLDVKGGDRGVVSEAREKELRKEGTECAMKVCAKDDQAYSLLMGLSCGFQPPEKQSAGLRSMMKIIMDSDVADSYAPYYLRFYVEAPEIFADLGLNKDTVIEVLERKARIAAKSSADSSLQLAELLFRKDKKANKEEIHRLVAKAIEMIEKQGVLWNPYAYEYLGELFTGGFNNDIIQKDDMRASKYFHLAEEGKHKLNTENAKTGQNDQSRETIHSSADQSKPAVLPPSKIERKQ
jgi:hypothetical protein